MTDDRRDSVEDYTQAFLCMACLVLTMALVAIWAVWGYAAALAACAGLDVAIHRLGVWRAGREAAWDARVAAVLSRRS